MTAETASKTVVQARLPLTDRGSGAMSLPRVLVVDDHAMLREALVELLDQAGFDVAGEAADGAYAVALVEQLAPDVVLMDLRMPSSAASTPPA